MEHVKQAQQTRLINKVEFTPEAVSQLTSFILNSTSQEAQIFRNNAGLVGDTIRRFEEEVNFVTETLRYTVNIGDYIETFVGGSITDEGYYGSNSFYNSDSPEAGEFSSDLESPTPMVAVNRTLRRVATMEWKYGASYSIRQLAQSALSGDWNFVQAKIEAIIINYEKLNLRHAFLGHATHPHIRGLFTQDGITIRAGGASNAATNPVATTGIGEMQPDANNPTESAFFNIASIMVRAFQENADFGIMPNTLVIPGDDFANLSRRIPTAQGSAETRLDALTAQFNASTGGGTGFRILPHEFLTAANQVNVERRGIAGTTAATRNAIESGRRYVLYNRDRRYMAYIVPQTLRMDNTLLEFDGITYKQKSYAVASGVLVNEPKAIMYFDQT